jgi:hypothetical protein
MGPGDILRRAVDLHQRGRRSRRNGFMSLSSRTDLGNCLTRIPDSGDPTFHAPRNCLDDRPAPPSNPASYLPLTMSTGCWLTATCGPCSMPTLLRRRARPITCSVAAAARQLAHLLRARRSKSDRVDAERARLLAAAPDVPHCGVGRLDMAAEAVRVEQGTGQSIFLKPPSQ